MKKISKLLFLSILSLLTLVSLCSCGGPTEKTLEKTPTEPTPQHTHTFATEWTKDSTHHWYAATCEHNTEVKDKVEHTWNEGEVITQPTEEAEGVKTYACTVCGQTKTEPVEKLPHTHKFSEEYNFDGYNHWKKCSCGKIKESASHKYGEWIIITEATENSVGSKKQICSICSYENVVEIPKLPHTHKYTTEWTKDETHHWYAATCEHNTEVKDKAEHTWNEGEVTTQPTEEAEGVKTYACTVCGQTKSEPVEKLPHTHKYATEWTKDETHHWYAATCEHNTEVKDKAKHAWNEGEVTTQPTEEAEGVKTYACTVCGQTKTEPVEKLPHTHKYATEWTKDETHHWYAATCEHNTEVKDKAEHTWNEGEVTTQPTEEAEGVKTYACTVCGQTKTEPVEKLTSNVEYNDPKNKTLDELENEISEIVKKIITDLYNEYDELVDSIETYDDYIKNKDKITNFYNKIISESEKVSHMMYLYTAYYAENILYSNNYCDVKYELMDRIYDEIYNELLDDLYDDFYNGIINDAYDELDYSEWSQESNMAYKQYSNSSSDVYQIYSNTSSDIYKFISTIESDLYTNDLLDAKDALYNFKLTYLNIDDPIIEEQEYMKKVDQTITIEKQVIYNENDFIITVNSLEYKKSSFDLLLTFENNTEQEVSFVAGALGYNVNSVNGWMIEDGYVNCDVESKGMYDDNLNINYNTLYQYGITEIAVIEIGFMITNEDYKRVYTGALKIETSIASNYNSEINTYDKVISNGTWENKFECEVVNYTKEVLYSSSSITIESVTVVKNRNGKSFVLLEIKNDSIEKVIAGIKQVFVNDKLVEDYLWSTDTLNSKTSFITYIDLENLIDDYEGNIDDVKIIKRIKFEFGIGEAGYDLKEIQNITLELPNIEVLLEE